MSLELIRRKHKWLTRVVLFFVSIAFVFGIGSLVTGLGGFSSSGRGSAAEINGEEISRVRVVGLSFASIFPKRDLCVRSFIYP